MDEGTWQPVTDRRARAPRHPRGSASIVATVIIVPLILLVASDGDSGSS